MKWIVIILGGGLIGAITAALGVGWVDAHGFNLVGAVVNILAIAFWIAFVHLIAPQK